jgi:subtilisin family serine protease
LCIHSFGRNTTAFGWCLLPLAADGRNNDITPSYPASYDVPNIISVGAITSSGDGAWFTNYGSTSVDLFAPGLGIYSTWPVDTYKSISGTSMSTPHVTGAAALYAAAHKATTGVYPPASLIKAAILTTGVQDTRYQVSDPITLVTHFHYMSTSPDLAQ